MFLPTPIFLLVTCQDISDPIVVVQFTWQLPHPFTVRALYDLRVNHLKVGHTHPVKVYVIISPSQEVQYSQKAESDFLIGLIDKPFQWSMTSPVVAPADLHVMWNNTQVHVIHSKTPWKNMVSDWLQNS